jgi:hypothetical protein
VLVINLGVLNAKLLNSTLIILSFNYAPVFLNPLVTASRLLRADLNRRHSIVCQWYPLVLFNSVFLFQ